MAIDVVVEDMSGLAEMRRRVGDFARWAGAPSGDVVLAANELATNSLKYTGDSCRVIGDCLLDGVMRITVTDRGGFAFGFPAGPAHASSIGGRGLAIVRAIATRCGISTAPQATCVWFEIDLPTRRTLV